jgi:hypothetical protein
MRLKPFDTVMTHYHPFGVLKFPSVLFSSAIVVVLSSLIMSFPRKLSFTFANSFSVGLYRERRAPSFIGTAGAT